MKNVMYPHFKAQFNDEIFDMLPRYQPNGAKCKPCGNRAQLLPGKQVGDDQKKACKKGDDEQDAWIKLVYGDDPEHGFEMDPPFGGKDACYMGAYHACSGKVPASLMGCEASVREANRTKDTVRGVKGFWWRDIELWSQ